MKAVKNGKTAQLSGFACLEAACSGGTSSCPGVEELGMTDVIFVALTIAVFVVLGLVVKAVEGL
jgi:hypothetical protein